MRRPTLMTLAALLPLALVACLDTKDEDDDGDTGAKEDTVDEDCYPYCDETETSIATTDDTALGVTGAAVVDPLPAEAESDIVWSDSGADSLSWGAVAATETLAFVERTEVYPECEGDVPSIGVECPDLLRVSGSLTLVSSDGRLDAALAVTFEMDEYSVSDGHISFSSDIDASDLGSSFDVEDFVDMSQHDEVSMSVYGYIDSDGDLHATLGATATGDDGNVAWAEFVDIAAMGGGAY